MFLHFAESTVDLRFSVRKRDAAFNLISDLWEQASSDAEIAAPEPESASTPFVLTVLCDAVHDESKEYSRTCKMVITLDGIDGDAIHELPKLELGGRNGPQTFEVASAELGIVEAIRITLFHTSMKGYNKDEQFDQQALVRSVDVLNQHTGIHHLFNNDTRLQINPCGKQKIGAVLTDAASLELKIFKEYVVSEDMVSEDVESSRGKSSVGGFADVTEEVRQQ